MIFFSCRTLAHTAFVVLKQSEIKRERLNGYCQSGMPTFAASVLKGKKRASHTHRQRLKDVRGRRSCKKKSGFRFTHSHSQAPLSLTLPGFSRVLSLPLSPSSLNKDHSHLHSAFEER